ncbi:MAG: MFS transporter [Oscillospiraceae bacterium]|nr:MFS transporter [Oscillospiraceae bacterium]
MQLVQKAKGTLSDIKTYWNIPMPRRYMTFKEILAYSGGGIGAYFIIQLGSTLLVGTQNVIVGNAIGVAPTDMYLLYIISTLANIPLTAVRANIVDNTRNKKGKYRPYILSMGIPTALIAIAYVWFPYSQMYTMFPGKILGYEKGYIIKCAMVLLFSLLLQFFFNFFNDAYTNLIHVLSPNTQERTDVLAVKSVVYSFAPSVVNLVLPLIAKWFTNDNLYDIRVYRYTYPVFAIFGIALTIIVYAHTKEKIVQARTHTIQIRFTDALREVAKNKYFWIIACAGWLGFLETSYGTILQWSYSYGHTCEGGTMAIINTLTGNASLWGMLLAPICIKKWGKKKVLVGVNLLNIVFILSMLIDMRNIWWLFACVYLNWLVGAFEQITSPAIQADIRDYQQYQSGERIDGMFAAVSTIGSVVTLVTSSVIPMVQKYYGIYEGNGYEKPFDILDINNSGPDLLYKLMSATIIMAAVGAFMNVVPYFFYDLKEKQQKAIVRILKIRALFEDYGNGVLNDGDLVEAIDIINETRELENAEITEIGKDSYKKIKDKAQRKAAKKLYRETLERNENIEIAAMVGKELGKFQTPFYKAQLRACKEMYAGGLAGILTMNIGSAKEELAEARSMPRNTEEEKEYRKYAIQFAKKKITACKEIAKHFSNGEEFTEPDYSVLEGIFERQDYCDNRLNELSRNLSDAKDNKDSARVAEIKAEIKEVTFQRKVAKADEKEEINRHVIFNRAAKPYMDAKRIIEQAENYTHLDEIEALYDEAKARYEAKLEADIQEAAALMAEKEAMKAKIRAEKAQKKANKKNK